MATIRLLELLILLSGFLGLLLRRNLYLKVLAMDVMGGAVVSLFVLMAARTGLRSPILSNGETDQALVAVELAVRGHLSPGGGFAAGVAGGTAIGLVLISGGSERSRRLHERWHADLWEKAAVMGFVVLSFLALEGLSPGAGEFGSLLSGGWIPLLNLLVALKVTLGSWAMIQRFVQHRGLL